MNLFKIIFLFGVIINSSYSAGWDHNALVHMSWRAHWEEALERMEGSPSANICDHVSQCIYTAIGRQNILTQNQRTRVLERAAQGRGRTVGLEDLIADLSQGGHPNVGAQIALSLDQNFLNNQLIGWDDNIPRDMRAVLESGTIPMEESYHHQSRDRRWTAGWILEAMDIARQQPITQSLFNAPYDNIANNDLFKARELSGTFGVLDNNGRFVEQFSGMIQPGQKILRSAITVNIISCLHGFWNQQLGDLYFLPKGSPAVSDNLFPVNIIQMGNVSLNNSDLQTISNQWNQLEWGELFKKNDYVTVQVNNAAAAGPNTLKDFLIAKKLLKNNGFIIDLTGNAIPDHDFYPNRIFAFGKPALRSLQVSARRSGDNDGFCLVSDVSEGEAVILNNPRLVHPLRRLQTPTDQGHYNPITHPVASEFTILASKQAASMPMTPGMSGGPVLRCLVEDNQIRCRVLGVAHGINLIEVDGHVLFKGLIAIPPVHH